MQEEQPRSKEAVQTNREILRKYIYSNCQSVDQKILFIFLNALGV